MSGNKSSDSSNASVRTSPVGSIQFTDEQQEWIEYGQYPTAEGEVNYAQRDIRKVVTKLQWHILTRAYSKSKYRATPPHKLTLLGAQELLRVYADPEEIEAWQAEARGETEAVMLIEPAPVVADTDLTVVDTDAEFLAAQQKKISPERFELEEARKRAADPNNPTLRKERYTACYPCRVGKRTCSANKKLNPDETCEKCLGNHGTFDDAGIEWDGPAYCSIERNAAYDAYLGGWRPKADIDRARHQIKILNGEAKPGSRPYNVGSKKRKADEANDAGEGPSTKRTKRK
jgi:hypothetical protein